MLITAQSCFFKSCYTIIWLILLQGETLYLFVLKRNFEYTLIIAQSCFFKSCYTIIWLILLQGETRLLQSEFNKK